MAAADGRLADHPGASGVVAAIVLGVGAYIGGDVVYYGGMGVDEAILKPGLRPGAEPSTKSH